MVIKPFDQFLSLTFFVKVKPGFIFFWEHNVTSSARSSRVKWVTRSQNRLPSREKSWAVLLKLFSVLFLKTDQAFWELHVTSTFSQFLPFKRLWSTQRFVRNEDSSQRFLHRYHQNMFLHQRCCRKISKSTLGLYFQAFATLLKALTSNSGFYLKNVIFLKIKQKIDLRF